MLATVGFVVQEYLTGIIIVIIIIMRFIVCYNNNNNYYLFIYLLLLGLPVIRETPQFFNL